jgi:uncharacterized cupin superfamily protein
MADRPPFIIASSEVPETVHRYPHSEEEMAPSRAIGRAAGMHMIGVHLVRVPPGRRTSYPHAEDGEEEFVYVIEGEIDAWIDGELHRMVAGDFCAFPSSTGISHTFLNNGDRDALLLSGGETSRPGARIFYPLNPERRKDMPWSLWWDQAPRRPLGPHDGKPDRRDK